ncbi:MAG TPA: hypothetical protein VF148_06985 [Acidimicrobiia bacterium]
MATDHPLYEAFWDAQRLGELRTSPYSLAIEFAWGVPESDWAELRSDFDPNEFDGQRREQVLAVGEPVLELARGWVDDGVDIELRPTDVGRGFSGEGMVLIIAALWATVTALSNIEGFLAFCSRVRELYNSLFTAETSTGNKLGDPMISLGTAIALCIADLADRIGGVSSVQLLSAIVHPGPGAEPAHSGHDFFSVVFVRGDTSWAYLMDSDGRVLSFVEGEAPITWRLY